MPRDWAGRWTPFPPEGEGEERARRLEDELLVYRLRAGERVMDRSGRIITEVRDRFGHLVYQTNIEGPSCPSYIDDRVADKILREDEKRLGSKERD